MTESGRAGRPSFAFRAFVALAFLVGFYVLAVAVAGGLLWFAYAVGTALDLGAAKAKIIFACVAGAATILWSLRPRRDHFEPPGPQLTAGDQPALFTAIAEVARATNQAIPAEVFAMGTVNAWVADRGGVMGIGGHRVMALGLPLMNVLNVAELKAVLAHEFGHYGAGDTRMGRLVHRTHLAMGQTLEAVSGRWTEALFRWYGQLMQRVSMAVSRRQEFAADEFAARATSAGALASGLTKVDSAGLLFDFYLGSEVIPVLGAGYLPPVGAGFVTYLNRSELARNAEALLAHLSAQRDRTFDSHPPTADRVAALHAMALPPRPGLGDHQLAISLVRDVPALEAAVHWSGDVPLKPVAWADLPDAVFIPAWREAVKADRAALEQVHVHALPTTAAAIAAVGRLSKDPNAKLMEEDDLVVRTSNAIALAVGLKLLELGWKVETEPGTAIRLVKGSSEECEVFARVGAVLSGGAPLAEWVTFCRSAGLSGPLAHE